MPLDPETEVPTAVGGALLASGFPFQTAIAEVIQRTPGWHVTAQEFPWQDASGADQFVDMVAVHETIVVVIECKKTQKETLTFLHPNRNDGRLRELERIRCVYTSQIKDSTLRLEVFAGDWGLSPESAESMFCVVSTSTTGRDQRMLERDAQLLVRGTDAYAHDRRARFRPSGDTEPDRPHIPLIITNAPLFSARYDPKLVSLETGQFETLPEVKPARWIRFRKSFSSDPNSDLGDRTVLVVNARFLSELLRSLGDIVDQPKGDRGRAIPPKVRR